MKTITILFTLFISILYNQVQAQQGFDHIGSMHITLIL